MRPSTGMALAFAALAVLAPHDVLACPLGRDSNPRGAPLRSTIDWRRSPWIAETAGLDETRRGRHEAALDILDAYATDGTPFALYLRTFHVRQLYCHASVGGDGGDGILLDVHFTRHLRDRGGRVVRVQDVRDPVDIAVPNETPALLLGHATWLEAVRALIDAAELIISECQFLSPGVVAELEACADAGKMDRTVLVLPSPPFEFIGNEQAVRPFPRVIQQHDMDPACPARTPVFHDLVERIGTIAACDAATRTMLIQEGRLREAIPVTFAGVADDMWRLARRYAEQRNIGATYFMGSRAALAARAAGGAEPWIDALLALVNLCQEAGNVELAVTVVDEVDAALGEAGAGLAPEALARLLEAARRRRSDVLAVLFESRMSRDRAQELWQLASAQASKALERQDIAGLAQCLAWMSVAANLGERYELAADHARDAIQFAQQAGDAGREAFAQVYLGHALRALGRLREAAQAYGRAIERFPKERYGRMQVVTFASLADVSQQLGQAAPALELYRAARDMAAGLGQADLERAAVEGMTRLAAHSEVKPEESS